MCIQSVFIVHSECIHIFCGFSFDLSFLSWKEFEELIGISYKAIVCRDKELMFDYIQNIKLQYANQEENWNKVIKF